MTYVEKSHKVGHVKKVKQNEEKKSLFSPGNLNFCTVLFIALVISVLHRNHISGMFESDRHFSHLSTLERELTFRTEMGLYYSYFKTIVEAPSFLNGLHQVMYDNVTEFPLVINTLKRFNLYPEVFLGAAYRIYDYLMKLLDRPTMDCYQVTRGKGLSPVQSCEGLGEMPYFYVEAVFLLNGLMMGVFFIIGYYLSDSYFGGILTVLCFFFNHGECTRVQWTPPLRECFAYPFLVLQILIVTHTIKSNNSSFKRSIYIALATASFMLPWQFAQFAFLMQTLSLMATYLLGFISAPNLRIIIAGQLGGLLLSVVFLFGNEMLVTSFFSSSLLAIWIVLYLENLLIKAKIPRLFISLTQGLLMLLLTYFIKIIASRLLNITDDEHIGDIFRSKFTNFKNFHTLLYVCAPEFDFLEMATPVRLSKTLLLPASILSFCLVCYKVILPQLLTLFKLKTETEPEPKKPQENNESPSVTKTTSNMENAEMVYHVFQLLTFTSMAVIIMRLKLFWTPHLCIFVSFLASSKLISNWISNRHIHISLLVAMVAIMGYQGMANLKQQWSIQGEFSNVQMEELIDWINNNTSKDAVFGGPMPTMATIKLCTGRPIVNHPHYEDQGLRNRTVQIYTMYSRKGVDEVHKIYKEMQIGYFIVEKQWCYYRSKPGCGMTDIWDMEEPEKLDKESVCKVIETNPQPYFERLFMNDVYQVFKVL